MNTTKKVTWSVGRKLGAGFSAIVFLALVVGVVGLLAMNTVSVQVKDSAVQTQIQLTSDKIASNLLEARLAEKNFFINYKTEGVEQAKSNYVSLIDQFIEAAKTEAKTGYSLARIDENQQRFQAIEQLAASYAEDFQGVVDLVEKRGNTTNGVETLFLTKADEFQKTVMSQNIDLLTIDLLLIRGHGKDYVLYRNPADAKLLAESANKFKEDVTKLPVSQLDAEAKNRLITLANEYQALSDELSKVDFELNQAIETNDKIVQEVDKAVKDIQAKSAVLYSETLQTSDNVIALSSTVEIVVLVLAILMGFAIAFGLSRNISKPLSSLNDAVLAFANGNLSRRVEVSSNDELGVLAEGFNQMTNNIQNLVEAERKAKTYLENTVKEYVSFVGQVANGNLATRLILSEDRDPMTVLGYNLNQMVANLSELTSQIREATANISSAAAEILAATMQQVSGTNEQSAAITQTTSTITEVKTIVEQAFNKAEMVAQKAQRSNEISQSGQKAVTETVEGMNQIKEKVAGIAENILALSEQTQRIGEITATVNEIAAQSNLLALNASVEAARAGEHGKGFAVVAVEVRNLAEQSKQATAQVKTILNEIQKATNAAVMATEEGTKGVDVGVMLTHETGNTITVLSQSITESANAAQQIVASTKQQSAGMEQIALAMQNINQATIQNLASTRQTERSAQDLSSVAKQLDSLVARYKLN